MANILSQDEIDALMGAVEEEEAAEERDSLEGGEEAPIQAGQVVLYDFRRPNRTFFKEQLAGVVSTIGAPDVVDKLHTKVERTRAHVLTRLGVEIDILCRRLKTKKPMFWQSAAFAKGVLAVEILCSFTTIYFAYLWIHNPTTTVSVQMILAGSLVYLLGRFRRHIEATY